VEIFHSTPEALFADNVQVGGEVKTSLITCMPGCYSSMARVKQAYRRTENLFYATEKMLSAAKLAELNLDLGALEEAQKKLLLASFHDILPGTCIQEGEKEGLGLLASCEKTLKDYRTQAFLYLTMQEPCAKEGEFPVFAFNYFPYELTTNIEAEFSLADQNWSDELCFVPHVYDENGKELVCQQIKEDSTLNLDWRKRIVFTGKLNPLGITRFTVKVLPEPIQEKKAKSVALEEYVQQPVGLVMFDDTADPWGMSLEELKSLGKNPEEFRFMNDKEAGRFFGDSENVSPVRVIEDGEIYTGVEALYTYGNTNAVLEYKLYKNEPYTDLKIRVEFAEKNKA
jgi:alpha-mannosidase